MHTKIGIVCIAILTKSINLSVQYFFVNVYSDFIFTASVHLFLL